VDIIGDRNNHFDLNRIANCEFDACIDTCAYFPTQIALVANILKIRYYCLVSSVYVYADRDALLYEGSSLIHITGGPGPELTLENYGALKALCEETALRNFGSSTLILRPSIIIGIGDHTERLIFWMRLAALHGKRLDVFESSPVFQLVDVRDLAYFTVRCIEMKRQGAVNVCGKPVSLSYLLDLIQFISDRPLERKSVRMRDLSRLGLERLPYCELSHFARYATSKSHVWGFTGRDLKDSLRDIYVDLKHWGFVMNHFQAEEVTVTGLFA
jgi:nucleoside-diphosphate-sugar epimerase